jgi:hypothetical protein
MQVANFIVTGFLLLAFALIMTCAAAFQWLCLGSLLIGLVGIGLIGVHLHRRSAEWLSSWDTLIPLCVAITDASMISLNPGVSGLARCLFYFWSPVCQVGRT